MDNAARQTLGALALALFVLQGAGALAAEPPKRSHKELSRQAFHYYKKGRTRAAIDLLEQAIATPEGAAHFKSHFVLARAYTDALILEKAFPVAEKAKLLAGTEEQKEESERLLASLSASFGGVTFRKAPEQKGALKRGMIHLEDTGGLINARKKKLFETIAARFRSTPVELPLTIYLPFGSYTANRAPFTTKKGEVAEAVLFLYNPNDDGRELMTWPAWTAAGVAALSIGAGATFYALASGSAQDARDEQAKTGGGDPAAWDAAVDRADGQLLLSRIGFGLGAAALVTAGVIVGLNLLGDEPAERGESESGSGGDLRGPNLALSPHPYGPGLLLRVDY